MRKGLIAVLAVALVLGLLGCAFAAEAALPVLSAQTSDAVTVRFEVTEARYDGHALHVTLVQTADVPQVLLYDDSVSGMTEEELLPPLTQRKENRYLGVYSEWALLTPEGDWMVPNEGESLTYGNPLTETWHWYVNTDQPLPQLTLRLWYGLVETPGDVDNAQLQCCEFTVEMDGTAS